MILPIGAEAAKRVAALGDLDVEEPRRARLQPVSDKSKAVARILGWPHDGHLSRTTRCFKLLSWRRHHRHQGLVEAPTAGELDGAPRVDVEEPLIPVARLHEPLVGQVAHHRMIGLADVEERSVQALTRAAAVEAIVAASLRREI